MIKATVIKDSTSYLDIRLTTMVLEYPRYIHADFMTHRVFNRNASSTRAVPYEKFKQRILDNNFYPLWTINQKGMQGESVENEEILRNCNSLWTIARDQTLQVTDMLNDLGIHKQHVNRLLEPFQTIQVIVTFTDIENFFNLRDHKDAQPEIQILAKEMRKALRTSIPQYLEPGQWHIPFDPNEEEFSFEYSVDDDLKISVARCARISYNNVDGSVSTTAKDLELFNKLIIQRPLHASPAEHQARVPSEEELDLFDCKWTKKFNNGNPKWIYDVGPYHSNLTGWIQYRKLLELNISNGI